MDEIETHLIGRHRITLHFRDDVGPASPYSLLLAENIPDLTGKTVVDLGTGSGILAIVASLQGAKKAYLLDTYDKAITLALENGERNGVGDRLVHLPIGSTMIPLPAGEKVDFILSNPAQLPLPQQERENSPFYAGPDGRSMIDALVREAHKKLNPSGHVLMTHNSLTNLRKTFDMLKSNGLRAQILAERAIAFRSFIDRAWLDKLGGEGRGLVLCSGRSCLRNSVCRRCNGLPHLPFTTPRRRLSDCHRQYPSSSDEINDRPCPGRKRVPCVARAAK